MNDVKTVLEETSFWHSKASQRRVTEMELRLLTRSSVDVMEGMIRAMQYSKKPGLGTSYIHH